MTRIEETRTRYELLKAVNKLNVNMWRMIELQKKAYNKTFPKPYPTTFNRQTEIWEGRNDVPRHSVERR